MLAFVHRVLVVDDDEDVRDFLVAALSSEFVVFEAGHVKQAIELLRRERVDVVLTDLRMPGEGGEALLRTLATQFAHIAPVVLTAHGSVATAVEAMKLGAVEFLEKPVESPHALRTVIERVAQQNRRKIAHTSDATPSTQLSWSSPSMRACEDTLRRVAGTQSTLLLLGESGVGKEEAARAVHQWSTRSAGPFVAINCASLSESLLESELFGHERGAFTGANAQRAGRIEGAKGGTFLLDEIGELKPELQARLLRVIQTRTFTRVGGNTELAADVRWIAATHRSLSDDVQSGRFREDLYHRLAVFPVRIPPLRERREDIVPLANLLLDRAAKLLGRAGLSLDADAPAQLMAHRWPGNVRELANVLERAVILADGPVVSVQSALSLGTEPTALSHAPVSPRAPAEPVSMANAERDAIVAALAHTEGNRRRAAQHLGIGLRTLYEKLKRYDL
ncbi:MAG: sigma-54 dependent transcriptional regulator [Deltaproteobacteria bacterium]|nr:sigma-54 dependent transcriptional regulator [Deltaproteobacteria bacterium]